MFHSFQQVDAVRREIARKISPKRKSELGQFMTPATVARFMASLFSQATLHTARLLDAGAGIGSLSKAFVDRFATRDSGFRNIEIAAYEIDSRLRDYLAHTLADHRGGIVTDSSIVSGDFIEEAVKLILGRSQRFSHAILNPPYKKIKSAGRERLLLRQVGIETVNLYSAFVALSIKLMQPGGEIVAIIPRSFCNGPYYRPFRELLFAKTAIKRVHLFGARDRAFKDDDVLQENIIIMLERGGAQGSVTVSTSTDDKFADIETHTYPFDQIVMPGDPERFIHVPTSPEQNHIEISPAIRSFLVETGLEVSTGPVVDFRLRDHLRPMPERGTVPCSILLIFRGSRFTGRGLALKRQMPSSLTGKPKNGFIPMAVTLWLSGFHPRRKSAVLWRPLFIRMHSTVLCSA